ncbi:hypothetical protein [Rhodococcus globerulus]|uniref:Uncharacterized protein n=1 Tax=Rhodococcus globerulus TaxID=33008 RepID=A0ABU4BS53_RHOGO|nr:hypothetical protein [Rhodococcus globerulus]MDV6267034.1 hypothetical protein [Rhodococcus globerulus]
MSAPVEVYRSTDPEVLNAHRVARDAWAEHSMKVHAYAESVTGDKRTWTSRFLSQEYFDGLYLDVNTEVPELWRRDRREPRRIVPNRKTKEGREVAAEFKKLGRFPNLRAALPGMPSTVSGERDARKGTTTEHTCGVELVSVPEREVEVVEVTWGCIVPPEKVGSQWRKVLLSQWHREQEAKAAEVTA